MSTFGIAQLDVGVVERLEDELARAAREPLDALGEVVDRHRRARVSDVEALADRVRMLEREQERLDHVVDVAPRADLRAVAVDHEVVAGERRLDEGADRPAADLSRPVHVERAHRDGRHAELVVVRVRHVLAGELRDRVRPARLADRALRGHVLLVDLERVRAEDLARRELDDALDRVLRRERRLERVVGADEVHAHRPHGALDDGVDAGDRGGVDEVRRAAHDVGEELVVEDVALDEGEVRMLGERGAAERVAMQVVDGDDLVVVDEPRGERRADEPGATRDDDALSGQGHAGESRRGSAATLARCARSSGWRSARSRSASATDALRRCDAASPPSA